MEIEKTQANFKKNQSLSIPQLIQQKNLKKTTISAVFYLILVGGGHLAFANATENVTPEMCVDKPVISNPKLVAEGQNLFKNETFLGNGRTCETCHRENHNFTIDPAFIATLSPRDPLFVAEFMPALRMLENSQMLRKFGLICENLDGFDKSCVFRSVPHLLSLSQTTATGVTDPVSGPVHETGWSADGAPGDGSLRCFALGAIIQHFPKTLNRQPGTDFRLPTEHELDALLAFQLSLGRQTTSSVQNLTFLDARAQTGKNLFFGGMPIRNGAGLRTCSGCHTEAGSNNGTAFNARNRITNVNFSSTSPACSGVTGLIPATLGDGGFGKTGAFDNTITCAKKLVNAHFIGNTVAGLSGFFNVPSLHETADTAPFFHNNAFKTLEEAINFYSSDVFNNAAGNVGRAFIFGTTDVQNLSIFLRTLNAIENIRSTLAYIAQGKTQSIFQAKKTLKLATSDIDDALKVLTTGPLIKSRTSVLNSNNIALRDAILSLTKAKNFLNMAISSQPTSLTAFANKAQTELNTARSKIVIP